MLYYNMKNKTKNFIRQKQMRSETVRSLVECISRGIDTKRKIMAETGFSWGSVATLTTEFLDSGVIVEYNVENDRRTTHYRLTNDEYYALGVEVASRKISFSLAAADGTLLETLSFAVEPINNTNCCEIIKSAYEKYSADSRFDNDKILVTACALTGAVDGENLVWLFSPHHPEIKECELAVLKTVLPGKLKVEHDIFSKARSIYFHHHIEEKSSVFIHVGEGIGLAACTQGEFFSGKRGFSGEIGHIPFGSNNSAVCRCGKKGCLECSLSLEALKKYGVSSLAEPFTFLCVTAVNLFDPEYLVVGGEAVEEMIFSNSAHWQQTIRSGAWMQAPENILFYRMDDCLTSFGAALGCRRELVDFITLNVCR